MEKNAKNNGNVNTNTNTNNNERKWFVEYFADMLFEPDYMEDLEGEEWYAASAKYDKEVNELVKECNTKHAIVMASDMGEAYEKADAVCDYCAGLGYAVNCTVKECYTIELHTEHIEKEMFTGDFETAFDGLLGFGACNDEELMIRIKRDDKTLVVTGYGIGVVAYVERLNEDEKEYLREEGFKKGDEMFGDDWYGVDFAA